MTEELRQSSLRAAARGCKIVETLLPAASADEQQELRRKLEWLEARLLSPEPGAAPPAAWEPTRKEPQPAATNGNGTKGTGKLTRREVEVVKHIAEGNSTKRVAEILGITFKTAACHRYRIMDKLGIHETANLVRFAIRQGMVEP